MLIPSYYRLPRKLSVLLILSVVILGPWGLTQADEQQPKPSQDEIDLALMIVNDYRQLRSSCIDSEESARQMCYYRLKVGQWDYHEARTTLTRAGIRSRAQELVAQAK